MKGETTGNIIVGALCTLREFTGSGSSVLLGYIQTKPLKNLIKTFTSEKLEKFELFKQRLQLYCYSLEFLDSPCNMIVDEYYNQIYALSLDNNQTNLQRCKTLTLCS
ncbi:hypothetical protein LOAG_07940 [Loa loa]|uniref:Uncharacterized protein n=1 Tax=Loa loa TaxID=7209 RepID=A0A1S0TVH2_LOALO|nr:hypothetical protein LOAG_07940 [Loa loa]EFO20552.1 hypothetical protein LOAG_07940 [Loa loa]